MPGTGPGLFASTSASVSAFAFSFAYFQPAACRSRQNKECAQSVELCQQFDKQRESSQDLYELRSTSNIISILITI